MPASSLRSSGVQSARAWRHEDFQASSPIPVGGRALYDANKQHRAGHGPGKDNASKDFEAFHRSAGSDIYTPRKREVKLFSNASPVKAPGEVSMNAPWHRAEEVRAWGPKRGSCRLNKTCIDESTGDARTKNVGSPDFPKMLVATSPHKERSPGYARMLKGKDPNKGTQAQSMPAGQFTGTAGGANKAAGIPTTQAAVKNRKIEDGKLGKAKNIKLETGKVQQTVGLSPQFPNFMVPEYKLADSAEPVITGGIHSAGKADRDHAMSVKHNIVHPGNGIACSANDTSHNFPFNPKTRGVGGGTGMLLREDGAPTLDTGGKPTHAGHRRKADDDLGRPERGKNTTTIQQETGKIMNKNIPSVEAPGWMKSPFEANREWFESPTSHVVVQALRETPTLNDPDVAAGVHKHPHLVAQSKRMDFPELDAEAYRKTLPTYMRATEHNQVGTPLPSTLCHPDVPFDFQVGLQEPNKPLLQRPAIPGRKSTGSSQQSGAFPKAWRN